MDAVITLPRTRGGRPPETPPETRRTEEELGPNPRILIVEDEFLVATEIEAGLSENGFDVVGIATTAAEAIRLAKAERPTRRREFAASSRPRIPSRECTNALSRPRRSVGWRSRMRSRG
jgi:hypothetical protein